MIEIYFFISFCFSCLLLFLPFFFPSNLHFFLLSTLLSFSRPFFPVGIVPFPFLLTSSFYLRTFFLTSFPFFRCRSSFLCSLLNISPVPLTDSSRPWLYRKPKPQYCHQQTVYKCPHVSANISWSRTKLSSELQLFLLSSRHQNYNHQFTNLEGLLFRYERNTNWDRKSKNSELKLCTRTNIWQLLG